MSKVFSIPVSKIDIEEVNKGDFLKLKMYVISDGVNRNNSEFLREGFEESIKTIYNKPILAYFNKVTNDTEEHNSKLDIDKYGNTFYDYDYKEAEKPVGVIPESSNIHIEEIDGKSWVVIEPAYVWTEYNKRLIDVIKKELTKKVSVEIESIDSYVDDEGIERIRLWKFLGVTILGKTKYGTPIEEGVEGAKLVLEDYEKSDRFSSYRSKFTFAFTHEKEEYSSDILEKYGLSFKEKKDGDKMEEFIAKTEYGTGDTISVDKSKDSVSNDSWGDIDKTGLRNAVLKAKNYKTIVKSVYLSVEDGWEDAPSQKLKYPVMQYKDGKFVYNAAGLLSAQQYGEKYDDSVAKKALSLRKKLGLVKSEGEEKMKKFIDAAKEAGFVFVGAHDDKLDFVPECDCDEEDKVAEKKELTLFEVDKCTAEQYVEEKEFGWDELTGRSIDLTTRDDGDHTDYEKQVEELQKKVEALENEKAEMAVRCEKSEKELSEIRMAKFKEDTDAILADEDSEMDEDTHEDLKKMRDEGKFASVEEFAKEVAYRKYLADKKEKEEMAAKSNHLSFSINKTETKKTNKNSLYEKLEKI